MTQARALPQTVLREATDRRLLDETIRQGRTTRAELADVTGYSRPTVSEAVRRLVGSGLLDATGLKETGRRGRVGTFYSLGARAGWVLGLELDQSGVHARSADLAGRTLGDLRRPPTPPGDRDALVAGVRAAVGAVTGGEGPLRAVAVSIANPVDPLTHQTVPLAGTPFPEGLLSPGEMIGDLLPAPILVDNDVNLAALAEHRTGRAAGAPSFAYVYVGAGLGVGLYLGDQLIRGAHGLAGEIGYLPGVNAPTLAGDLASRGLARSDAPSNDVAALLRALDDGDERILTVLADAVGRAIISVAAVVDPALVLLGGPVGTHPALLPRVRAGLAFPGPLEVEHGTLGTEAALTGALHLAVEHARAAAVASGPGTRG
ncbi:ROK family transcriptional regulator [Pseudosporangium ferrugineum]|uniref:Putative NBD/HSP70 family sugar kinase n=1 Tax=Pseudosporangium ferrugineum TaxID=439699 RepID=A0A2T0RP06_9ACTN|nr:ROK family transcriptional regulator [Pseudosporangium ferrugineum]PRY22881.1 putative NBD/HSP70 family sugar kinase [Pseudosporangium ferrugineum]